MDPIATATFMSGEPLRLFSPASTAPYDPAAHGDYAPGAPVEADFRGFQSDMDVTIDPAVKMAFTIQTKAKPAGLSDKGSTALLRGLTWTVLKFRERRYQGQINGFTLYLGI